MVNKNDSGKVNQSTCDIKKRIRFLSKKPGKIVEKLFL
jgi:hypothetical protein